MPTPEQQAAFGAALRSLMNSHQISQRELGVQVAEGIRGADKPYAQSTVRDWIEKSAPDPEIVFYIEGFLLVPAGTLSQHLGYLPTNARSVTTVGEALMIDTSISGTERDLLLVLYALFADKPLGEATISQWTRRSLEGLLEHVRANEDLLPENKMKWDNHGRLVEGFDVAPARVVMLAIPEWAKEPSVPMPAGLLVAAREHRKRAAEIGFADEVERWDELLKPYEQVKRRGKTASD